MCIRDSKGSVDISHIKTYGEKDVTMFGESKKGWRLVRLDGDREFLDSLEQFPESKRFTLGSGFIQIRGGKRAAEPRRDQQGAWSRGRGGARGRGARGRGRGRGGAAGQGAGVSA